MVFPKVKIVLMNLSSIYGESNAIGAGITSKDIVAAESLPSTDSIVDSSLTMMECRGSFISCRMPMPYDEHGHLCAIVAIVLHLLSFEVICI